MNPDYYELRYIETSTKESNTYSLFDDTEEKATLLDLIKNHDRIILLGNPGVGKTTELKHIFKILWEEKSENLLIPFFVNVKNFRQTSTIEDIIQFDGWKKMPSVVFIFDGLDEIGNIQDFISELENFMSRYSKLKLKFLISCRTNIYEKYLINISKFEVAYLNSLSYYQIDQILNKKYGLKIPYKEVELYYTLLQTPFYLDLFAKYYTENKKFPESQKDSWELFLNKQIKDVRLKFKNRFTITEAQITLALQQVAITNELMQQNAIDEKNLLKLLGDYGIEVFQQLPFIKKLQGSENYIFVHKNYQEYFAAQYLSALSKDDIIKFISADNLDKIKPSLFNTTTFLLNILDGDKFENLKKWLFKNEIEILFFADSNRLSYELKNEIFELYFKDICIDKTFWISNSGKVTIDILAKFADFKYLIKEISNRENHGRIRLSALEVLAHKPLSSEEKKTVKELFLRLLESEEKYFQSEVLRCIKSQKFHKEDNEFLKLVLGLEKTSENRDISHQVIAILCELDDEFIDVQLLLTEVKYYFSTRDNVIRGTEHLIASVILNTKIMNLHLGLINILFDENYALNSRSIFFDNFNNRVVERAKFFSSEPSYVIKLAEIAFSGQHRISSDPLLENLILEIGLTPEIVIYILKRENLSTNVLYSICRFLDKSAVDAIVDNYISGELHFESQKNIESFRNWLSNHDTNLAIYMQEKFINTGYQFSSLLKTEDEIKQIIQKREEFQLYNFNLLFEKNLIKREIKWYFQKHGVEYLSNSEFQKLFFDWYDELNYHGIQYTIHTVIETALRWYKEVSAKKISMLIEDPFFYLSTIKTALNHSSLKVYNLTARHMLLFQTLSSSIIERIDFNNVINIDPNNQDSYSTTINYSYLKLVSYFDLNYEVLQSKEFYLKALEFGNITSYNIDKGDSYIDHVIKRTDDPKAVSEKVINNILKGNLIYFSKRDHVTYAIENDLRECYEKIGEEVLSDQSLSLQENILEKYLAHLKDPLEFLKKYCNDFKTYEYWFGIKLIKKYELDNNFILNASLEYLKTDEVNFVEDALNILFSLNSNLALQNYYDYLKKTISLNRDSSGSYPNDVLNYTNLKELYLIEGLFNLIYSKYEYNSFYLHLSRKFMSALTANLSQTEEGYNELMAIFKSIKEGLALEKFSEAIDYKIYYINDLINISNNSQLKSKSGKLSFDEAVNKLK